MLFLAFLFKSCSTKRLVFEAWFRTAQASAHILLPGVLGMQVPCQHQHCLLLLLLPQIIFIVIN